MAGIARGAQYENFARDYLGRQGLVLLEQNYHCRLGEIDLIMRDGEVICFIEVKYRKSSRYGGAASAIPPQKQRKLIKSALFYLSQNQHLSDRALRFDALLIQRQADGSNSVDWIKSAFDAE